MAKPAIVDSVVLIAAFLRRDQRHREAFAVVEAADAGRIPPLVLTDFILAETLNYVTRKAGTAPGREALRRLESSSGFRVERISDEAYTVGKNDVYQKIDGLSFVDAVTVAFMRSRGSTTIYSFDRDFDRVPDLRRLEAPDAS